MRSQSSTAAALDAAPHSEDAPVLCALDRAIIDRYQRGFPLTPAPFADVARELGSEPEEIIKRLRRLQSLGVVGRVGAAVRPRSVRASMLAALPVPPARLAEVAAVVNALPGVNHNYEREHRYNLWFVVAAADAAALDAILDDIETRVRLPLLRLPLQDDYHIDLGFRIHWS